MKVLHREIEKCKECPAHYVREENAYYEWDVCTIFRTVEIEDIETIPFWCPLPDKEVKG